MLLILGSRIRSLGGNSVKKYIRDIFLARASISSADAPSNKIYET